MPTPSLTPEQLAQVSGFVAQYIATQRENALPHALPLDTKQRAAMHVAQRTPPSAHHHDSAKARVVEQVLDAVILAMELIPIPGAALYYDEHFLSLGEADQLLNLLTEKCAWERR